MNVWLHLNVKLFQAKMTKVMGQTQNSFLASIIGHGQVFLSELWVWRPSPPHSSTPKDMQTQMTATTWIFQRLLINILWVSDYSNNPGNSGMHDFEPWFSTSFKNSSDKKQIKEVFWIIRSSSFIILNSAFQTIWGGVWFLIFLF